MSGTVALVGGGEFLPPCAALDRGLLAAAGTDEVLVLPTAAAYQHPGRAVDTATAHFAGDAVGGAKVRGLMVLARPDAFDEANVAAVRSARFIYLTGGSPMHLRAVLKDSPLWQAVVDALADGAVIAGSSAGAMVLTDPMVDPRGGAFTLGLGLLPNLTVVPHHDEWSADRSRRTFDLAPKGVPVLAVDTGTAAVRDASGTWSKVGTGNALVYLDGRPADLSALG
jgi:cyanophycinase